jgi:hypothetical protein
MNETHASTVLTYWSPGGDLEWPLNFDPKAALSLPRVLQMSWVAEWRGRGFLHTHRLGGGGHYDEIINYTTWDGRFWQARWYENGNEGYFIHTRNGQSHKDRLINYLDWEGNLWSATRKNATEFQHVFFAEAQIQRSFLDQVASWVVQHWHEIAGLIIDYVSKTNDQPANKKLAWSSTISKEYGK